MIMVRVQMSRNIKLAYLFKDIDMVIYNEVIYPKIQKSIVSIKQAYPRPIKFLSRNKTTRFGVINNSC